MMKSFRHGKRYIEAQQRTAERRQRENDALRLSAEVPRLSALRFEIENGDARYVWPIVIERAPALFRIVCPEDACKDGGHDVTGEVMYALRRSSARMEGQDVCHGQVRSGTCGRVLHYVGLATYGD
jgi:hypothetical protein